MRMEGNNGVNFLNKKTVLAFALAVGIAGCNSSNSGNETTVPVEIEETPILVTLHAEPNTLVEITTINGDLISSKYADEAGEISYNKTEITQQLKDLGFTVTDKLSITDMLESGSILTASISLNDIELGAYVTNISTLVDGITNVKEVVNTDLYNKTIVEFLKQTGMPDVNQDEKINHEDVNAYNKNIHSSDLEDNLEGKTSEEAIIEYQKLTNLVFIDVVAENETHEIQLSKNNSNSYIEYYISTADDNQDPVYMSYIEGETIYLNPGETTGYRENFGDFVGKIKEYNNSNNSPLNVSDIECDSGVEILEGTSQTCFIEATDNDGIVSVTATLNGESIDVLQEDNKFSTYLYTPELGDYTMIFTVISNTYNGDEETKEISTDMSVVEDVEGNAQIEKEDTLSRRIVALLTGANEIDQDLVDSYQAALEGLNQASTAEEIMAAIIIFNNSVDDLNTARNYTNNNYTYSVELSAAELNRTTVLEQTIVTLNTGASEPTAERTAYTNAVGILNSALTVNTITAAINTVNLTRITLNNAITVANIAHAATVLSAALTAKTTALNQSIVTLNTGKIEPTVERTAYTNAIGILNSAITEATITPAIITVNTTVIALNNAIIAANNANSAPVGPVVFEKLLDFHDAAGDADEYKVLCDVSEGVSDPDGDDLTYSLKSIITTDLNDVPFIPRVSNQGTYDPGSFIYVTNEGEVRTDQTKLQDFENNIKVTIKTEASDGNGGILGGECTVLGINEG